MSGSRKTVSITIGKKLTINTGNYSSIQPSVSITMDDVDLRDFEDKHASLETLASSMLVKNIQEHLNFMEPIKRSGPKDFVEAIDEEVMESEVDDAIKSLME